MFPTRGIHHKRVIVTGGLGFIGRNLAKRLAALGAEVVIVDDCSNSTPDALYEIGQNIQFHQLSVLDDRFLDLITDDTAFIFHLACRSIITCSQDPFTDLRVNAESTLKILEYLRYNMPSAFERFVYTSSTSVYGNARILPIDEEGDLNPLSQYAATKMLGERYTMMYHKLYGIPVACTRFSNVYGYGQSARNPYCGVIGLFIDRAVRREAVLVYGDGEQTRDYTFVTDAVWATLIAATHPAACGEIYNVATNREYSVNQLVAFLRAHHFPQLKFTYTKERTIDNIRRRIVDTRKIGRDLGWHPEVSIEDGLNKTIDWYKRQLPTQHSLI